MLGRAWNWITGSGGSGDDENKESTVTRLPPYFPVEPKGCEKVSQKLFHCLVNEATQKARDMEKAGLHKSYFTDVTVPSADPKIAKLIQQQQQQQQGDNENKKTAKDSKINNGTDNISMKLPQPGDNPLDECRLQIVQYEKCCNRELKKRKNWILTEPYRVQEEYRYRRAAEVGTEGGSGK